MSKVGETPIITHGEPEDNDIVRQQVTHRLQWRQIEPISATSTVMTYEATATSLTYPVSKSPDERSIDKKPRLRNDWIESPQEAANAGETRPTNREEPRSSTGGNMIRPYTEPPSRVPPQLIVPHSWYSSNTVPCWHIQTSTPPAENQRGRGPHSPRNAMMRSHSPTPTSQYRPGCAYSTQMHGFHQSHESQLQSPHLTSRTGSTSPTQTSTPGRTQ